MYARSLARDERTSARALTGPGATSLESAKLPSRTHTPTWRPLAVGWSYRLGPPTAGPSISRTRRARRSGARCTSGTGTTSRTSGARRVGHAGAHRPRRRGSGAVPREDRRESRAAAHDRRQRVPDARDHLVRRVGPRAVHRRRIANAGRVHPHVGRCGRRASGALRDSLARRAYVSVANQNGKLFERINTDYATNTFMLDAAGRHRPGDLHDAERPALPGRRAPARQRADLPHHRLDQPLHVRHAARRRPVRRRQRGHADADRRRVRHHDRPRQRLPRARRCPGKMYIDSGGGTAANLFQADLYAFPTTGFSPREPAEHPGARSRVQRRRRRMRTRTVRP